MDNKDILEKIDDLSLEQLEDLFEQKSSSALKFYTDNLNHLSPIAIEAFDDISISYLAALATIVKLRQELNEKNEQVLNLKSTFNHYKKLDRGAFELHQAKQNVAQENTDKDLTRLLDEMLLLEVITSPSSTLIEYFIKDQLHQHYESKNKKPVGRPKKIKQSSLELYKTFIDNGQNVSGTAKQLGISRKSLRDKIKEYRQYDQNPEILKLLSLNGLGSKK